jgi:hypothetical protein
LASARRLAMPYDEARAVLALAEHAKEISR